MSRAYKDPFFRQLTQWVCAHAGCHYLENQEKWSCHTTLGSDIYELAYTKQYAQIKLRDRIYKSAEPVQHLKRSRSFLEMFPPDGAKNTPTVSPSTMDYTAEEHAQLTCFILALPNGYSLKRDGANYCVVDKNDKPVFGTGWYEPLGCLTVFEELIATNQHP